MGKSTVCVGYVMLKCKMKKRLLDQINGLKLILLPYVLSAWGKFYQEILTVIQLTS